MVRAWPGALAAIMLVAGGIGAQEAKQGNIQIQGIPLQIQLPGDGKIRVAPEKAKPIPIQVEFKDGKIELIPAKGKPAKTFKLKIKDGKIELVPDNAKPEKKPAKVIQFQLRIKDGKIELVPDQGKPAKQPPKQPAKTIQLKIKIKDGKIELVPDNAKPEKKPAKPLQLQFDLKDLKIELAPDKAKKAKPIELEFKIEKGGKFLFLQPGKGKEKGKGAGKGPEIRFEFVRPKVETGKPSRDRLEAIEDQLQKLLKEVQELRKTRAPKQPAPKGKEKAQWKIIGPDALFIQNAEIQKKIKIKNFDLALSKSKAPQAISLSRATYQLPKGQAAVLATLLKNSRAPVMETKIEGNALVVTTTPQAQQTIRQFISLMQGQRGGAILQIDGGVWKIQPK